MIPPIRTAAVLGAGTMGAQIAAHLGNAGIRVLLLDLTPDVARDGLTRARALKPDPFFTPDAASLIDVGGFDTDLPRIAEADWVIEAIVEKLDVKRDLFARVEQVRRPGTLITSNTSGIPIAALAEGRSADFIRHFAGTHFFNPPRYLRLVEVIPTPDTDPAVTSALAAFVDHRLGKGVVIAKDTPSFIANRVGLYAMAQVFRALASGRYTIEEIDAITGPALGRPRSATFRTADIAGLDIVAHVTADLVRRLEDDESKTVFTLPPLLADLVARGWIGEKAGQGFYKRQGGEILTLDPSTMTYRARQPAKLASLEDAKGIEEVRQRTRTLFLAPDKVGQFLRETLGPTLVYTARIAGSIAHGIDDIDRAMSWGFGWELGPFETWDAIGIREVLEAVKPATVPDLAAAALSAGRNTFREGRVPAAASDLQILKSAKDRSGVVRRNAAGSLVDLGDGVLALELHSKMNAIGGDTVQMIQAGIAEASRNFAALVVGTDANDFSAGANLMLVLIEAQDANWDEIDLMVRTFQGATQAIRYAPIPVVVAPAGLALGGGCEIVLHADRVQAAAESYIGLVEVGVGLIPAGGGTKEMMARASRGAAGVTPDHLTWAQAVFETIGFGKVSTSAAHARTLGLLRDQDVITMNRERLMADAKALALDRVREGYRPPASAPIAVGGETVEAALKLGVHLAWRAGRISDHDALIGRLLAHIIAGGSLPHAARISEAAVLDLEREAFLKLCGQPKTLERIGYTLKTGKTLRN
jgi:3-hydroxyacyl-CoA dehydrogenase